MCECQPFRATHMLTQTIVFFTVDDALMFPKKLRLLFQDNFPHARTKQRFARADKNRAWTPESFGWMRKTRMFFSSNCLSAHTNEATLRSCR